MNVNTPGQGNTGSGGTPAHQMPEALEGHTGPLAGSPGWWEAILVTVLSFQMCARPCQCVCPASSGIWLLFRDAGGHSSAVHWPPRP